METQNFSNHVRLHPLYHFFMLPVSLLLIIGAIVNAVADFSFQAILLVITAVFIHLLAFLTRMYAKKNQDRIIRLELRLRYLRLTSGNFEEQEKSLALPQLLALRFASDEEFLALLKAAKTGNLGSNEIKKQIKKWKPDMMRV